MFTLKPVAYDFACSSGFDSTMSAARRTARTVSQAKYAIRPAPRRAVKGTHPWILTTAECAATDTARKIVSAVVAPMPTRNPARHDRVTVWDAMIAFTGPGGAARERPIPAPARIAQRISRTTPGHHDGPHETRAANLIPAGWFVRPCASADRRTVSSRSPNRSKSYGSPDSTTRNST